RAGVLLGLQQSRHQMHLVGADEFRGALQADEGLEPGGKLVPVEVPPAGRVGLPGQLEQSLPLGFVGDAVEREQVCDVALLEPDLAQLHPADLGLGRPDLPAGGLPGDALRLAQPAELCAQQDTAHGRTAVLELDARHFPCLRTYVQPTATGRRLCVSMPQLNQLWGDTYGPFLRRTGGTGAGPRRGGTRSAVSAVCPLRRPPTVDGRPRRLTPRSGQEIRSSNSPSLAPSRNASISPRVKTRTGPSGCREFRTATPAPPGRRASSTHWPWWLLRRLLRH